MKNTGRIVACIFVLALLVSCRTPPPLPSIQLSEPGWHLRQGQAVWRPGRGKPELAGDLLFAAHNDGRFWIQFTKTPFPLVTARRDGTVWQIEFQGHHPFSGKGEPPKRFVWFEVPRIAAEQTPASPWRMEKISKESWRIENPRTGESLEGFVGP